MQKYLFSIIVVLLIVNIVFGYIIFNNRGAANRINQLNQQLRTELESTRSRIAELERIQEIDRRTISDLRTNQQQLEKTNKQLTELLQRQGNSISTIETGLSEDRKNLQRLSEIIKTLSKAK